MSSKWKTFQVRMWRKQNPLAYLLLSVIIVIGILIVRYRFNQDKWDVLTSRAYGYRIEYPANWAGEVIRAGRGAEYLHGRINDNDLLPRSYMLIHTQPMDAPTFEEGATWAEEMIERDCGYVCWEGFQPRRVGVGDYLALVTTYQERVSLGQTLFKEAILIVADDKVFMLQLNTYNRSQEIEAIFNHMIDSFEVIEVEE